MGEFINDNAFSKKYEILLAREFTEKGYNVELAPDKKFLDWDLLIDNTIGIEVKADKDDASLRDNPNIVIEWKSNGMPSGIQASKAKWYVYFYTRRNPDCWGTIRKKNIETYKVDVSLLKEYIKIPIVRNRIEKFEKADNNTWGYLIPISILVNKNIAVKINPLK